MMWGATCGLTVYQFSDVLWKWANKSFPSVGGHQLPYPIQIAAARNDVACYINHMHTWISDELV